MVDGSGVCPSGELSMPVGSDCVQRRTSLIQSGPMTALVLSSQAPSGVIDDFDLVPVVGRLVLCAGDGRAPPTLGAAQATATHTRLRHRKPGRWSELRRWTA